MKKIIIPVMGLLLWGCNSTDNDKGYSDDPYSNIAPPPPATHQDKYGGKEAAIGVALATTLGVITKDNFECSKECEKNLKESLAKEVKHN